MKPEEFSVSTKQVPQIHSPSPRSPRLPREDPDSIRGLALKAGWNLQLLQNAALAPRKCPVLPSFVPRAKGQGLTVSGYNDETSQDESSPLFHGSDVTQSSKAECPFRNHPSASQDGTE